VFVFRYGIHLLLLGLPPSRLLGAVRIVERRKVFVSGSDRGDCEEFLIFPRQSAKRYYIGLLVACVILILYWFLRYPIEGLACDAN
jgi:hypothetical protein